VEDKGPRGQGLLEQARAELAAIEGRVDALRSLLDRAVQAQAAAGYDAVEAAGNGNDARTLQARSMASHMALSGYPRWSAEDRLRGTVGPSVLNEVLDQVYGPQSRAG